MTAAESVRSRRAVASATAPKTVSAGASRTISIAISSSPACSSGCT